MAETKTDLFDVVRMLFTDTTAFNNLSKMTLERNAFMINRFMAIKYPQQAQAFNNLKINTCDVMRFWNSYLGNKTNVPSFIYTKGSKKSKETLIKANKMPSNAILSQYCINNHLNKKDVLNAFKMFPDEMYKEISNYEKELKRDE